MNRITRIEIENYRSIKHAVVELGALNVLVGKNGAGKSNFLDAIKLIADIFQNNFNTAIATQRPNVQSGSDLVYNHDVELPISIKIYLQSDTLHESVYHIEFYAKRNPEGQYPSLLFEAYHWDGEVIFARDATVWQTKPQGIEINLAGHMVVLPLFSANPKIEPVYQFFNAVFFHNVRPDTIGVSTAYTQTQLKPTGVNFATALHYFQENSPNYKRFVATVRHVLPHIADIQTLDVSGMTNIIFVTSDNMRHALALESLGTRQAIGLLFAMYQEPRPTFIAIEEPDNFIHAASIAALCDELREAALSSQVVVTTHSPDMIARFDVNDLRIVERTDEGTQIGYLDDVQRESVEREIFGSGSLLRIDGELRRQAD